MPYKKTLFYLSSAGVMLLIMGIALLLLPVTPVGAQCGSQASSCKNCHEVQGQLPVNNDGTNWHESHAFGDFCYMCHAGNPQATDADAAHTGMVDPLSDIDAACKQCHAADLTERAQVYATILGVDLNSGGGTTDQAEATSVPSADSGSSSGGTGSSTSTGSSASTGSSGSASVTGSSVVSAPASTDLMVDDPNVVDYVQRYNEIVLGEYPTNWGNVILGGLIGLMLVGGGGFVVMNEIRLSSASHALRPVEGGYSADVVDMLPALAKLKPHTRKALENVLAKSQNPDKVLDLINAVLSDQESEE